MMCLKPARMAVMAIVWLCGGGMHTRPIGRCRASWDPVDSPNVPPPTHRTRPAKVIVELKIREVERAPDGHILIDMMGYEKWIESR
jgi:hypothetical protein